MRSGTKTENSVRVGISQSRPEKRRGETEERRNREGESVIPANLEGQQEGAEDPNGNESQVEQQDRPLDADARDYAEIGEDEKAPAGLTEGIHSKVAQRMQDPQSVSILNQRYRHPVVNEPVETEFVGSPWEPNEEVEAHQE